MSIGISKIQNYIANKTMSNMATAIERQRVVPKQRARNASRGTSKKRSEGPGAATKAIAHMAPSLIAAFILGIGGLALGGWLGKTFQAVLISGAVGAGVGLLAPPMIVGAIKVGNLMDGKR